MSRAKSALVAVVIGILTFLAFEVAGAVKSACPTVDTSAAKVVR